MQTGEQRKVFKPTPHNVRKIILSTNIAETSLNIDDVIYVIDSGKMKEVRFFACVNEPNHEDLTVKAAIIKEFFFFFQKSMDPLTNASSLKRVWISRACAEQRKGRAGRVQPGVCYRLFSSIRFQALEAQSTPELLRLPLQVTTTI